MSAADKAIAAGLARTAAALASLELSRAGAYDRCMSESPTPMPAPARWREELARSKAQIAAGESVPLLPVLDRLRVSAERLEAEQGITADGERVSGSR